ncbi:hypothetical protein HDU97_005038 [Phlyctochytrium planicorne]|nr:hypothetical protein HDU97_005038 [Phlyctochytrium planicorne]
MGTFAPSQWIPVLNLGLWTPTELLKQAILSLNLKAVKVMLNHGAEINDSAIDFACYEAAQGRRDVLDHFISLNADPMVGLPSSISNLDLCREIVNGYRNQHGRKPDLALVSEAVQDCFREGCWDVFFDFLVENSDMAQEDGKGRCIFKSILSEHLKIDTDLRNRTFDRPFQAGIKCVHWDSDADALQKYMISRGHTGHLNNAQSRLHSRNNRQIHNEPIRLVQEPQDGQDLLSIRYRPSISRHRPSWHDMESPPCQDQNRLEADRCGLRGDGDESWVVGGSLKTVDDMCLEFRTYFRLFDEGRGRRDEREDKVCGGAVMAAVS